MIKRLIDFYAKSSSGSQNTMSALWQMITNRYQAKMHEALISSNAVAVKSELDNMAISGGLYGIDNPAPISGASYNRLLERLAVSVGILPLPNPEQPFNCKVSDDLRSLVEKELGITLTIPECFGYTNSNGTVARVFIYLSAFHLVQLLQYPATGPDSILEIGGGMGLLGYFAWKQSVRRYAVIDLPIVAILNAYFCSKYCPSERIWLWGEPENPSAFAKYYPSTHPDLTQDEKFDVAFNCDSLPEMTPEVQKQYLVLLHGALKPSGRFLSINHESSNGGQRRVYEACKENGHFNLVHRAPSYMRDGYIEEIWAPA